MKKLVKMESVFPLSQAVSRNFIAPHGYDPFADSKPHDGGAMYDSYLHPQKNIANCLTNQKIRISFVGRLNKSESSMSHIFEDYE